MHVELPLCDAFGQKQGDLLTRFVAVQAVQVEVGLYCHDPDLFHRFVLSSAISIIAQDGELIYPTSK
jgi:hypothetical protein